MIGILYAERWNGEWRYGFLGGLSHESFKWQCNESCWLFPWVAQAMCWEPQKQRSTRRGGEPT